MKILRPFKAAPLWCDCVPIPSIFGHFPLFFFCVARVCLVGFFVLHLKPLGVGRCDWLTAVNQDPTSSSGFPGSVSVETKCRCLGF